MPLVCTSQITTSAFTTNKHPPWVPSHNAREYCRLSILRLGQTTPQRRRQRRLPSPQHRRQGAPPPHRTPHASLSRSVSTHPWWHHQPHCHSHQGNQDFCQQGRVSILHKSNIASHTIRSQKRTNTYPSSQVGTQPSAGKIQTRTTTTPWPQDHAIPVHCLHAHAIV